MQTAIAQHISPALTTRQHACLSTRPGPARRQAWLTAGTRPAGYTYQIRSTNEHLRHVPQAVSDQQQPPSSAQGPPGEGGSGGGTNSPGPPLTADEDPQGPSGPTSPAWSELAAGAVLALCAVAAAWSLMGHLQQLGQQQQDQAGRTHAHTQALQGIKEDMAALKRLVRELFSEQLATRVRAAASEPASPQQQERADDYTLPLPGAPANSSSTTTSPNGGRSSSSSSHSGGGGLQVSWSVTGTGAIIWTQERQQEELLRLLGAVGLSGHSAIRLKMHSVCGKAGRHRFTSTLSSKLVQQVDDLMYRGRVAPWLYVMLAAPQGCLANLSRRFCHLSGRYGFTPALRWGHGLSSLRVKGAGAAATLLKGPLTASLAHLLTDEEEHCCLAAQLSWHTRGGAVVTLGATGADGRRVPTPPRPAGRPPGRLRLAAFQPPGWRAPAAAQYEGAQGALGSVDTAGAAVALPLGSGLTATAWLEGSRMEVPAGGGVERREVEVARSWGLGLFSRPADVQDLEMGVVLTRPSQHTCGHLAPPLLYEASVRVPLGDGLSLCGSTLATHRTGRGTSLAYGMKACYEY